MQARRTALRAPERVASAVARRSSDGLRALAEDYVDELGWNAEFTEFRVVAAAPISEFPDDRLDDLARHVELAVPLPEGAVQVRRIASGV